MSKVFLLSLALVCSSAWSAPFETLTGKVIYIDDGDTIVLLQDMKAQRKIRLSSIDAPESSHTKQDRGRVGQPFSENSGNFLASLVKGKEVVAHCFEADRYGRDVCEIFSGGRSVNQDMVRFGWAWANTSSRGRYLRDNNLPALQDQARLSKTGLWSGLNPVEPWIWRDACWKQGRC
jgi:micrococcal nuclease